MGLFSVEPRKESTSSYPLDFLNYSAVQRNAEPAGQPVECFQCISLNARRLKFHFHTNLLSGSIFPCCDFFFLRVNTGLIHL